MKTLIIMMAIILTGPPLAFAESGNCSLTIRVSVGSDQGNVRVALFDSETHWLEHATHSARLEIDSGTTVWQRSEMPCGEYAFAIYHDENDNGRLDRQLFGLPAEPYAFSNDARVRFGPPGWKDAAFQLGPTTELASRPR